MGTFELAFLVLTPGLECLEVLLDNPAPTIAVHGEGNLVGRMNGQVGEQKPLDCGFSRRWSALEDMDHVDLE
jgi:hypothetical protein